MKLMGFFVECHGLLIIDIFWIKMCVLGLLFLDFKVWRLGSSSLIVNEDKFGFPKFHIFYYFGFSDQS